MWANDETLKSLAKTLRRMHGAEQVTPSSSGEDMAFKAERHYKSIKKKGIAVPSSFDKQYEKFKEDLAQLDSLKKTAFCHNDLNPASIIVTENNKIYFVDFRRAGNGNIFEDLGYLTVTNNINGERLDVFLRAYWGRKPTDEEMRAVKLARRWTYEVSAIVWFDYSETKQEKKIPVTKRIANLDDRPESKDIALARKVISEGKYVNPKNKDKELVKLWAVAFHTLAGHEE
jgi:thiamine kinase-like enzyme